MLMFFFFLVCSSLVFFHNKNMFTYFIHFFLLSFFMFCFKWGSLTGNFSLNSLGFISMDCMSLNLIVLSVWCGFLMSLGSFYIFKKNMKSLFFCFSVLLLILILVFSFCVKNMMIFYIFFEFSLIPTFLLIMKWGYQPERIQASMYMLLYTVCASLPLLALLVLLNKSGSTLNMFLLLSKDCSCINWVWSIFLIGAFFVKMPLYFVHLWLPKAHVEAPVAGSMILAGVLLKLGSYGLIRVLIMWYNLIFFLSDFFICISLLGGVLTGMICMVQSDLKSLIAYSSVGHMGMLCGGLLTVSWFGYLGGVIMMVAHGLCSSGMFFISNILYQNSKSRSVILNKGNLFSFPLLVMFCFLLFSCNMSAPPSINLAGELVLSMSVVSFSFFSLIPVGLMVLMAGCYSMYLYSICSHGCMSVNFNSWLEIKDLDLMSLFLHFVPVWLIILNLKMYI